MTRILALETATEACSAALLQDAAVIERYELAPQGHARLILPMLDSLLAEAGIRLAQVDALAFGRGPGSFTGVRIAAGVVQGIAFGADLPVVPVSSLAAMAQWLADTEQAQRMLCAFDARMGQVYWGAYERQANGLVRLEGAEAVCNPDALPVVPAGPWVGAGSGWANYGEALARQLPEGLVAQFPQALPHAGGVARLALQALTQGRAVAAEQAQPIYLRDQVAEKARTRTLG
jgi:tRNA threonylcarbamoyladenosine biosynthesis protein TsaB